MTFNYSYLICNYISPLPWYTGLLFQIAGLFFLYLTSVPARYVPRWGQKYYLISSFLRPLGLGLIGWAWVEILSVSQEVPVFSSLLEGPLLTILALAVFILGLIDPFWRRIILGGIALMILPLFFSLIGGLGRNFFCSFLFTFGVLLLVWSLWALGIRRSVFYSRTDDPLMERGPYRYCRHPQIAAALLLVWSGVTAFGGGPLPEEVKAFYLLNWLIFTASLLFIVYKKEKDLHFQWGEVYQAYCDRVPRFFSWSRSQYSQRKAIRFGKAKMAGLWFGVIVLAIWGLGYLDGPIEDEPLILRWRDIRMTWSGHPNPDYSPPIGDIFRNFESNFLSPNQVEGILPPTIPQPLDDKKLFDGIYEDQKSQMSKLTFFYCGQVFPGKLDPPSGRPRRFFFSKVESLPFQLSCSNNHVFLAAAINLDGDEIPMVWLAHWTLNENDQKLNNSIYSPLVLDDFTNKYTRSFYTLKELIKENYQPPTRACGGDIYQEARQGNLAEVKRLLAKDPGLVNAPEGRGFQFTLLHLAAEGGYREMVEFLLTQGAEINARDKDGDTPLHVAAFEGHLEVVELLIAQGADVNARDKFGYTPLRDPIISGHQKIVELLIAKGAEVDTPDEINTPDNKGNTLLHHAAGSGRKELVELLLAKGAEVNTRNQEGETPLLMATVSNDREVIELLVSHGAEVNVQEKSYGSTPLHQAAKGGNKEVANPQIVQLLLAKGAKLEVKDNDGNTPLGWASAYGHEEVVELLLAHGADLKTKNNYGCGPLHNAALNGYQKVAEILLKHGAEVNARDNKGQNPLHYAAGLAPQAHKEMVEFLIAQGVEVNAKNNEGLTPLKLAIQREDRPEVVVLLRQHGAVE